MDHTRPSFVKLKWLKNVYGNLNYNKIRNMRYFLHRFKIIKKYKHEIIKFEE